MRKLLIILLIIIALVTGLVGGYLVSKELQKDSAISILSKKDYKDCTADCREKINSTKCDAICSDTILAKETENATLCDKILQMEEAERAYWPFCLVEVAAVMKDSSPCDKILSNVSGITRVFAGGVRDVCIKEAAKKANNPIVCNEITNSCTKSECKNETITIMYS